MEKELRRSVCAYYSQRFGITMTPQTAYNRLNRLIWHNQLPEAKVVSVDNSFIPNCWGVTLHDEGPLFPKPVILINRLRKNWGETLVHEALHVAEPSLRHGKIFEGLVAIYWRRAKKELKGWGKS